ncbi:hypothetical protein IWW50_003816, partial [Coemansia erecta]
PRGSRAGNTDRGADKRAESHALNSWVFADARLQIASGIHKRRTQRPLRGTHARARAAAQPWVWMGHGRAKCASSKSLGRRTNAASRARCLSPAGGRRNSL